MLKSTETKNKYAHVIWDWNGTLVNDVWLCIEIINDLLEQQDLKTITAEEYRKIFDFPILDYYTKLGFDFEKESFESLCEKFISPYKQRVLTCHLHENAKKVLNHFSEKGIGQSILSASEQGSLEEMVNGYELGNHFENVLGLSDNMAFGKVAIGKQLINQLNIPGEEIVYIGDTVHDFEVAEAIGVDCILVANGHHNVEKLRTVTEKIVDSLDELF